MSRVELREKHMFTLALRWSALALPMLCLMLSANPASAQAPGPLAPDRAPGQVVELVGQAATVLSTVHYQAQLTLSCDNLGCLGNFPRPGRKHRLNVTRMTCHMMGANAKFSAGYMELWSASNGRLLYQFLPVDYDPGNGTNTLNRAVDMQVVANQYIRVYSYVVSGTAIAAICTATGTLDTLE